MDLSYKKLDWERAYSIVKYEWMNKVIKMSAEQLYNFLTMREKDKQSFIDRMDKNQSALSSKDTNAKPLS